MEGGDCNNLDFQLGGTGIDATIPTRSWSIKVDLGKFDNGFPQYEF